MYLFVRITEIVIPTYKTISMIPVLISLLVISIELTVNYFINTIQSIIHISMKTYVNLHLLYFYLHYQLNHYESFP